MLKNTLISFSNELKNVEDIISNSEINIFLYKNTKKKYCELKFRYSHRKFNNLFLSKSLR